LAIGTFIVVSIDNQSGIDFRIHRYFTFV